MDHVRDKGEIWNPIDIENAPSCHDGVNLAQLQRYMNLQSRVTHQYPACRVIMDTNFQLLNLIGSN